MADIREYKCPACGGAMEFDSKTQKMKCPYCDTVADLSDFEETQSEKTASKEGAEQGETQEAAEEGAMMLYVCESCGGEILADKTTGQTAAFFVLFFSMNDYLQSSATTWLMTFPSAFPFISAITFFMIMPLFFVATTSANFS